MIVGGGGDFTVTHWIVWGRNREKKKNLLSQH